MALPEGLGGAFIADGSTEAAAAEGELELGHSGRVRGVGPRVKGQDVGDKREGLRHRRGDLVDLGDLGRESLPGIERMILAPDAAAPQRFQELR